MKALIEQYSSKENYFPSFNKRAHERQTKSDSVDFRKKLSLSCKASFLLCSSFCEACIGHFAVPYVVGGNQSATLTTFSRLATFYVSPDDSRGLESRGAAR
jgi:hypothetical protein